MSDSSLDRIKVCRLSGVEAFHQKGNPAAFNVQDFWSWSYSDLVTNTTRGILAEFIVAKALSISTERAREEWGAFDLKTDDGIKIEVKSAAYIQSWKQKQFSKIQFVVPKRLGWDPNKNVMESTPRRHADIYVFALLAHKDKSTIDPLDLTQWQFWSVSTRKLDKRTRSQYSITLKSLRNFAGEPVDFWKLAGAVNQTVLRQKEQIDNS